MLQFIIRSLYTCAALAVFLGIGAVLLIWPELSGLARILAVGSAIWIHGLAALACCTAAESIRVIIDTQENTQEAAYYAKLSHLTPMN